MSINFKRIPKRYIRPIKRIGCYTVAEERTWENFISGKLTDDAFKEQLLSNDVINIIGKENKWHYMSLERYYTDIQLAVVRFLYDMIADVATLQRVLDLFSTIIVADYKTSTGFCHGVSIRLDNKETSVDNFYSIADCFNNALKDCFKTGYLPGIMRDYTREYLRCLDEVYESYVVKSFKTCDNNP